MFHQFGDNLLVGHGVILALAIGFHNVANDWGHLVVSEKVFTVMRPEALWRPYLLRRMFLKKHVVMDSPFYFGVPSMLNPITVVVDQLVPVDRNHLILAFPILIGFSNCERIIGTICHLAHAPPRNLAQEESVMSIMSFVESLN